MNYILNIGMDRKGGGRNTDGLLMVSLLGACLLHEGEVAYVQSNTERTAVLQYEKEPTTFQLEYLCELLGQDCIALYRMNEGTGVLIGPKAEEWGPFNPEFFYLPDGTQLSTLKHRRYPNWPFWAMFTTAALLCFLSVPLNSPFMFIGGMFVGVASLATLD